MSETKPNDKQFKGLLLAVLAWREWDVGVGELDILQHNTDCTAIGVSIRALRPVPDISWQSR